VGSDKGWDKGGGREEDEGARAPGSEDRAAKPKRRKGKAASD